jgi:predicted restriction endonuclease
VFVIDPPDDDPGNPLYWQKLFAEDSTPFEIEPEQKPTVETLRGLYASVLAGYDYTCAITGRHFPPSQEFLHDVLQVAPIRPLTAGGVLHVSNFLCLEGAAADAFRIGQIAVGPRFELIVDLSRIDPELLERINPLGKLRLPVSGVAQPDLLGLAFHREHVFLSR